MTEREWDRLLAGMTHEELWALTKDQHLQVWEHQAVWNELQTRWIDSEVAEDTDSDSTGYKGGA